ncbi:MAG: hypothetical protein ACRDD2_07450 [Sarcina sp.]
MKRLAIVLLVAASVVGGIIFFESTTNNLASEVSKTVNVTTLTKPMEAQNFTNKEIINVANKSSDCRFNDVLNKEVSGNVLSTELASKNSGKYKIDFRVENNNLFLDGNVNKVVNNQVINNQEINAQVINNQEINNKKISEKSLNKKVSKNTNEKIIQKNKGKDNKNINSQNFGNNCIETSVITTAVNKNNLNNLENNNEVIIKNSNEALNKVLNYYKSENKNIKNYQSNVIANQDIGGKVGYLVQIYTIGNKKQSIGGLYLVTLNGNLYNANNNPLKKLN